MIECLLHSRKDIIHRSESMQPEEHRKFMHSVMSPFDAITKQLTDHTAIEESKYEEADLPDSTEVPRHPNDQNYLETSNAETGNGNDDNEEQSTDSSDLPNSGNEEDFDAVTNAELIREKDSASTEKNNSDTIDECKNCQVSKKKKLTNYSKDIDTPEGFQAFADGLIATD